MALTLSTLQSASNAGFMTVTEVTFDNNYAEGGEAFTPANAGLSSFTHTPICTLVNGSESEKWVTGAWYASEKLHLLDAKTGKELAKETDVSKVKVLVFAFGKTRSK